jgi:CBS domain-containing protein
MSASGTTPLVALAAAAVDCETTGLDPATARLLEIAAVALDGDRVAATPLYASLVDPGVAIPAAAAAVHGIETVAGAPAPAAVLPRFVEAVAGRVVIGHSIGFDLAIVAAECRRAGLPPWQPARTLDLRLLAQVVAPRLPGYSLEALAVWLDVPLDERHRAAGDARAAAALFVALVPRLREAGIRTLGEAEAACRTLTGVIDDQHLAGWAEPVAALAGRDAEGRLGRIDPFIYAHRVADLMTSPPSVVEHATSLRAVLARFADARIASVFVRADGETAAEPVGIVTERDALRAIERHGAAALDLPATAVMSTPLIAVATDTFAYRAIGRMDRYRIRHLGVTDESGRLVGALSMRDLLRLRAQAAVNLGDAIDQAADVTALGRAWASLPLVAEALLAEGLAAPAVAAVISSEVAGLTRRVAELAMARLAAAGQGPPPRPFSIIVLGSVGRRESLLAMDQDNALIYADGSEPDAAVDPWYAAFGQALADMLHEIGVPYCKGGVMAAKPAWRGSVATWRARITDWLRHSRPEDLLDVDIFFDLRPVYGEVALAHSLRAQALAMAAPATSFIKLLAEAGAAGGSPFGLLGKLREVDGRVDLKQAGLFRVVTAARCLAIRHNIAARGTGERLRQLAALGLGGEEDLEAYAEAHGLLLDLVLRQQLADIRAGDRPTNAVRLSRLGRVERRRLKAALKTLQTAPDLVRDLLFATPEPG